MKTLYGLLTLALLTCAATVTRAELTVDNPVAEGAALLALGQINEAVEAFDGAAKANPGDKKVLIARAQAKKLQKYLEQVEADSELIDRQKAMAKLHKFYNGHGLYEKSLGMEQGLYAEAVNDDTAALLADTLLAMQKNDEALATLQADGVNGESWDAQALLGLALARNGRMEQAQPLVEEAKKLERLSSGQAKNLASLLALTGYEDEANELLVVLFGATTQDKLPGLKESIRTSPDFQSMAGTEGFKTAMETEAKLKGCGGDCGSCPSEGCK